MKFPSYFNWFFQIKTEELKNLTTNQIEIYDLKCKPLRKYISYIIDYFQAFEERVANVSLAFDLMQDAGLPKPKARPEDIVNLDLKSTLRVLYNLFTKYKHLS